MKPFIFLAAILALTRATSGGSIKDEFGKLVIQELPEDNPISALNAPPPLPPDYADFEVSLESNITTAIPWNDDYNDPDNEDYKTLQNNTEYEVAQAMRDFTVTVSVTGFVDVNNLVVAYVESLFTDILGNRENDETFCTQYEAILTALNGVPTEDCLSNLAEAKESVCDTEDLCPPVYKCVWTGTDAECHHPCYTEQQSNPDFCVKDGQVCFLNTTDPNGALSVDCACGNKYLDTGNGCVNRNTIIIPSAVVGGVLLLALIITAAVLGCKVAAKEKMERERVEESLDDVFENKGYKSDDGDSGIAGPIKVAYRDEDPVYRDFDDEDMVMVTKSAKQNGSVQRDKQQVNGMANGFSDERNYENPAMTRDNKPSVRDYTPLNAKDMRQDKDDASYAQRGQGRSHYAELDELNNAYEEPQGRTNPAAYDASPQRRTNQNERQEPLYSHLNKNASVANGNRVLREPDRPYNRPNPVYDEPQNRRVSRTTQESEPYTRGKYGTGDRGYDRPTRAPGIPERRYSPTDRDNMDRDYLRMADQDYIPDRGSIRLGMRDASREPSNNAYKSNWDY